MRNTSAAHPKINILRLPHAEGLDLPAYHTAGAAGLDLQAALPETHILSIPPGERQLVETGFIIELTPGFEGQIRPRSGLAFHKGLTVLNAPGTIDSDYRGELKVLLINLGQTPVSLHRGDRIAQLIIAPVAHIIWEEIASPLSATGRNADGFGSTGR